MPGRGARKRSTGSSAWKGDTLPPVPRTPRLDTIDRVRAEVARVYRHCRAGNMTWENGCKAAHILGAIGRLLEGSQFEARLTALEEQQATAPDVMETKRW